MLRFKLGIVIGYALGWLVTSGKAAELIEQFRERRSGPGTPLAAGITPASTAPMGADAYDFADRATDVRSTDLRAAE